MKFNIPFDRVKWITTVFLFGTLVLSLTAVPWYLWNYDPGMFIWGLFFFYVMATGLSVTLGYHRLFSHLSFKAKWPVRAFVLIFGAVSFENSALDWCSDHRRHHKHVDHDDDPYNINQGFWHAHMGWMLFKLRAEPPRDNVADLEKDPMIVWQDRWVHLIGFLIGFVLPACLGYWNNGWVGFFGGLLLVGVLRTVFVQQGTFCINSFCHYIGRQPYSTKHTARDSALTALVTFGEGYHNYHHEFQHDYRNGVKPWQFDPTKWTIWLLSKVGLVSNLRRVPDAKICLAELTETRRQIEKDLAVYSQGLPEIAWKRAEASIQEAQALSQRMMERCKELQTIAQDRIDDISKDMIREIHREMRLAKNHVQQIKRIYTSSKAHI